MTPDIRPANPRDKRSGRGIRLLNQARWQPFRLCYAATALLIEKSMPVKNDENTRRDSRPVDLVLLPGGSAADRRGPLCPTLRAVSRQQQQGHSCAEPHRAEV